MAKRRLDMRLTPKQLQFMRSTKRHVCYGGARGGGKSWVVRASAMDKALKYPGIKQLIVRKTYTELRNNHISPLRDLLRGMAKYNDSQKIFTFKNGSTIALSYCASDGDLEQYQGAEYDCVYLEEATNLREEWIGKINACVRGTNPLYPKQTFYTCNPGGVGHAYIKRLFVDRQYKPTENPEDYEFIQAKVTDNKALMATMPEYVLWLKALPPRLRKMWLDGSWDVAEGAFFEDFINNAEGYGDRRYTHVIPAKGFKLPKTWEVYRSFDWGYRRPFSCGWWAVDYDGTIYRIAELYGVQKDGYGAAMPNEGVKWPPDKVFAEIAKMEREHPLLAGREITGVADPAIWDAEMGVSIAEAAANQGILFTKGDHARMPGWMQCHYRLQFDAEGYPRMYVLDSCKDFLRTIPLLQYDEHRPEELDTDGEDHAADEWRYFCMSRPIQPILEEQEYSPAYGIDPLGQFDKR
jgi:hypothetical protein